MLYIGEGIGPCKACPKGANIVLGAATQGIVVFVVGIWVVMALIVATVAQTKGRSGLLWFVYGLLLWPIALIAILVLPGNAKAMERNALKDPGNRKCPHCAEMIKAEAKVCKHCGRDIATAAAGVV